MATQKFVNVQKKLTYAQATPLIKDGDLFFSSGNGGFSSAIKSLSDSLVSHVGIVFWWGTNLMLLESVTAGGVRAIPLFHYTGNYANSGQRYDGKLFIGRYKNLAADKAKIDAMRQVAIDLFGFKYDNNDIAKILLSRLTTKVKRKEDECFLCSEYVEKIFQCVGINFGHDKSGFVFPEHIATDANVEIICEM